MREANSTLGTGAATSMSAPEGSASDGSKRRGRAHLWLWAAVALIVGLAAFIGVARATDASWFCNTCHEMKPFYAAWSAGTHGHEGVQCIDCHVRVGFFPRLSHKFVALGEVWSHFFGNRSFPLEVPPPMPNSWCARCHPNVRTNLKNFVHELHASKGSCRDCHPTTGHKVTTQALKDAGIFNPNVRVTPFALNVAIINGGRANVPGHITVVCSRCHDMKATGCRPCHAPPNTNAHQVSSDCTLCHKPGRVFSFSHPGANVQCLDCHTVPATHPANALGKACTICHAPGRSWTFTHPASATNCSDCHTPPANHFGNNCAACHHRAGVLWAFSHPSAGEHSWRSFPCAKCHSRGYTTAYCSCHGGNPPND